MPIQSWTLNCSCDARAQLYYSARNIVDDTNTKCQKLTHTFCKASCRQDGKVSHKINTPIKGTLPKVSLNRAS